MKQGTLDRIIVQEPRIPPFTTAGLLDYVVELIVSEDNVSDFQRKFDSLLTIKAGVPPH